MKSKRITAAVSAIIAAAMLSGCGSNSEKPAEATEEADFSEDFTAASAETITAVTEGNAQTNEAEAPTASSGSQTASEGQQTGNIFGEIQGGLAAEKPVEFTAEDIETIHGIFTPQDVFYKLLFADTPFDMSDEPDIDQILKLAHNWKNIIFKDMKPDEEYTVFSELAGDYVNYPLFKPVTIESAIRERLDPDFDISRYTLDKNTPYWNEERQMFDSIDQFLPEGYPGHIYEIVSEGQEGEYYCITVNDFDIAGCASFSKADFAKNYASLQRQKYTFRKLPNGNIAPLRMELTQPEKWEKSAAETAADIYVIKDECDASCENDIEHFYIDDINNDGRPDLIASQSYDERTYYETSYIYYGLDKNDHEEYSGTLYRSEITGDLWQHRYIANGWLMDEEYTNLTTGDYYYKGTTKAENGGDVKYYAVNDSEVDKSAYSSALANADVVRPKSAGFRYDISEYLTGSDKPNFYYVLEIIDFCNNELS